MEIEELTKEEKEKIRKERQDRILLLKGEAFDLGRRQAVLKRDFETLDQIRTEKINELVNLEKEDLTEQKKSCLSE